MGKVISVRNARTVCNDKRRTSMPLGFQQCLERLLAARLHRDLRNVDMAVGHREEPEILLGC